MENPLAAGAAEETLPPASASGGSTVELSRRVAVPPDNAKADYDPEREVEADIRAITAACAEWREADAELSAADERSNKACHRALGEIFVRSSITDEDPEMKAVLVDRVKQHPDVLDSNRYHPYDHGAAELHLTLQFGLKNRRGAKANWKAAIKAAEIEFDRGTIKERSVQAFCEWFPDIGMNGARELARGSDGKADATSTAIDQMVGVDFEVPEVWLEDSDIAPGYANLVIRLPKIAAGEPVRAEALGLVRDGANVSGACAALLRSQKRAEKEQAAYFEQVKAHLDNCAYPADLRIPKKWRSHFHGRTHFDHEDERNEFLREQEFENDRIRKSRCGRKVAKLPSEFRKGGKGKARLDLGAPMSADSPYKDGDPPISEEIVVAALAAPQSQVEDDAEHWVKFFSDEPEGA